MLKSSYQNLLFPKRKSCYFIWQGGSEVQLSSVLLCRGKSSSYHLQLILQFLSVLRYCIYFFNAHNQITAFFLIKLVSSIQPFSVILGNKDRAIKPKAHYGLRQLESCPNFNQNGTYRKVVMHIISILGFRCSPVLFSLMISP